MAKKGRKICPKGKETAIRGTKFKSIF